MTTQAQNAQDLASIDSFCNDLETYLRTGVLPVLVDTYKGVQVFHVIQPRVITHPSGDRKIACKVVRAPQGFEFMVGQHHSLAVLL